ncbi:TerB family tellurite resistance protein [Rufibacter quisquiliarum]|uniref:Putative tellurite resistance protein B-like protein n=1 Tax=Rufibacter quisquiliarum TaxID=1549639 RepID=A0A839GU12_9BACT|nr:TerB family tellurite resistance protein [Rufibacter quisquiliarum]MBA9078286.1 putative tellurite resistance protein B-like protein [Rufibacter quisquiliarum]
MGLFDKLFSTVQEKVNFSPKNEQEAWVGVMYGCIAVDGDVSESEIETLSRTVVYKSMFKGHKIVDYYRNVALFHKKAGSKELIDSCVSKVPAENRPTLFALTLELLLADGILEDKEKEIIDYLSPALELAPETAMKIVEVILIKNKGNAIQF